MGEYCQVKLDLLYCCASVRLLTVNQVIRRSRQLQTTASPFQKSYKLSPWSLLRQTMPGVLGDRTVVPPELLTLSGGAMNGVDCAEGQAKKDNDVILTGSL